MIVDKNSHTKQPHEEEKQVARPQPGERAQIEIARAANPMIEAYLAIKKILLTIRENENDPNSPPLFKTIKMDNGQLNRIKSNAKNTEYAIAFPAVFIHYIDVYYNQGTSNINEGKGTMRIHYVLNRLNNGDDGEDGELEGMMVYNRIISAIEKQKSSFPVFVSRFQLQYWDQPLTFDDGLQPYWIDYQIWFSDYSTYRYKDFVDAYIVHAPLTNHSDQNEIANPDKLPDIKDITLDDVSSL